MRARWIAAAALAAGCSLDVGDRWEDPPPPEPAPKPWGAPITGGTLLVTRDGNRAVVADPDRDRVVTVDLVAERVVSAIALEPGSEPGRVIEDGAGRIHVALRGSGELLTITGDSHELSPICGEPRGLAWQETGDLVHVACATGELVSVPAGGGSPVRTLRLERDLRDVIVRPSGGLVVSTFRSAQLIELDAQGIELRRIVPPTIQRTERPGSGGDLLLAVGDVHDATPAVAWRTIALPDGRILMSHQRRVALLLSPTPGGYGGGCGASAVESALTVIGTDGVAVAVAPIAIGPLPVDVAVDPTSGTIAMVTAGNQGLWIAPASALAKPDDDQCDFSSAMPWFGPGAPTAVAFRPNGALVAFLSESGQLVFPSNTESRLIGLDAEVGSDEGRALFHRETAAGIACASCHPEARDDGGVWMFDGLGPRRTQNVSGSILARAPYHWGGDMASLPVLLDDVFAQRMGGGFVVPEQAAALAAWLDRLKAPRGVVVDIAAVQRGFELFNAPEQGCTSCHNGELLTNNKLVNVGTNGVVKVPSLVGVGGRAPYMHDGCAATLRDRFGVCGGGDNHGHTSQLGAAELDDLIAYLESL